jgi:hypothetical protein
VRIAQRDAERSIAGQRRTSGSIRGRGPAAALRLEHAHRRWRIVGELRWRANRARDEVAAAVRATSAEPVVHAIATERALERADHRVGRRRRQIFVAAFAIGAQLEHQSTLLPSSRSCQVADSPGMDRARCGGLAASTGIAPGVSACSRVPVCTVPHNGRRPKRQIPE